MRFVIAFRLMNPSTVNAASWLAALLSNADRLAGFGGPIEHRTQQIINRFMTVRCNSYTFSPRNQFQDGARTHIRLACAWRPLNGQYASIEFNNSRNGFCNELA